MNVTDPAFRIRTARKAGRCAGSTTAGPCKHVIQPGEQYVEGDLIVDPPFGRGRYCPACAIAREMAVEVSFQRSFGEMSEREGFFAWSSHAGSWNVSRHPGNQFVCECGYGEEARDYARAIADALNKQARPE